MTSKQHKTTILKIRPTTHDVKSFTLTRPKNYRFTPGQATEVSINKPDWENKKRPFTFTSLNQDKVLEFIIKAYPLSQYPSHKGVTEKLHQLKPQDQLIIGSPWGTIKYKGKGVFLAGGAGITPFIAIIRNLVKEDKLKGNKLIFSNKTAKDIILQKEFKKYFSADNLIFTLTQEKNKNHKHGRINLKFLKNNIKDFSQNFYVCGPPPFVKDIKKALKSLGANTQSLVFEK